MTFHALFYVPSLSLFRDAIQVLIRDVPAGNTHLPGQVFGRYRAVHHEISAALKVLPYVCPSFLFIHPLFIYHSHPSIYPLIYLSVHFNCRTPVIKVTLKV